MTNSALPVFLTANIGLWSHGKEASAPPPNKEGPVISARLRRSLPAALKRSPAAGILRTRYLRQWLISIAAGGQRGLLCHRFYFPGPDELDQVMGDHLEHGTKEGGGQLLLQIFWVIQVGVLLSGPPRDAVERRGAQSGFLMEEFCPGISIVAGICQGPLPPPTPTPAAGAKESLLIVSESSRQTPILLLLLRLATEVGQNCIPQVEGGLGFVAICSTLLSGRPFIGFFLLLPWGSLHDKKKTTGRSACLTINLNVNLASGYIKTG